MNWGKGILAVCIIFVIGVGVMVYISMNRNIDLVTKNYYEEEIKYQQQIDKINNTNSLKEKVTVEATEKALMISFPKINGELKGEISMYRPSDAKKDFKLPVNVNENATQVIATDNMQKGLWKIQIAWNMNGKEYYSEEKIMIQ